MSNIDRLRLRIRALYDDPIILPADLEAILVEDSYRQKHAESAGTKLKYPTPSPEVVLAVRAFKSQQNTQPRPWINDIEIGKKFGIEIGGRVTEILYGDGDGKQMYDDDGVRIKAPRKRKA